MDLCVYVCEKRIQITSLHEHAHAHAQLQMKFFVRWLKSA